MNYFIIIRGPLGIGKSTIAKNLTQILGAKYFAVDRVLDDYDLTKNIEDGYVSQKSFLKANKIIILQSKKFLEKGISIIFDGNFYWKLQIDDLIKKLNFPYYIFTLKAPLEVCIERDSRRNKTYGQEAVKAVYKRSTEFNYGIIINTNNKTLNETVQKIISHLPNS